MSKNHACPPSFVNGNGTFEIGDWVRFVVDNPNWDGPTAGEIRHNGTEFYIRQARANLPIGPGFVNEESIRLYR